MTRGRNAARIGLGVAVGFAALLPLVFLVTLSVSGEWFYPSLLPRRWTGDTWNFLRGESAAIARSLWMSVALALGTGSIAAVGGFVAGREIARLSGWRRRIGVALAFLPVAIPPLALSIGLQYSVLRLGFGGRFGGVLFAHLVPALGYTTLFFIGIFAVFDWKLEDEARSLGAGRRDLLIRVTLPILRRPLVEAFALGFLVSWAQVPLTLLIGQGLISTLPLELMSYVSAGQDHLAATAGLILTVPPMVLLVVAGLAVRRLRVVVP